ERAAGRRPGQGDTLGRSGGQGLGRVPEGGRSGHARDGRPDRASIHADDPWPSGGSMSLFPRPPRTDEEMEASRPLEMPPEEVAELDEEAWHQRCYRGDAPQLTWRAVGSGAALGFLLALTNLYVGLKIGWHLGVGLTACILSFSLWTAASKAGLA